MAYRKIERPKIKNLDEAIAKLDRTLDDVKAGRIPPSMDLWRQLGRAIAVLDEKIDLLYPETARKADEALDEVLEPALATLAAEGRCGHGR